MIMHYNLLIKYFYIYINNLIMIKIIISFIREYNRISG